MKKITHPQPNTRAAFTLLELLAVITIISILLALILPAIGGAMRNARNAEVTAEFTRITTAITSFKSENGGIEPWSLVVLSESGTSWGTESRTRIRRIWPQYNFTLAHDFNGDGDTTDDITLSASECLVFFLGGMQTSVSPPTLIGFSKNPVNPFSTTGENRTFPYEFKPGQLVDTDNDGMLEYMDSLPGQSMPLLYVSSNNGQGYSKSLGSLNYYVQADGTTPWNKGTFQLISPGDDAVFGFEPALDASGHPVYAEDFDVPNEQRDNITNFSSGTLN